MNLLAESISKIIRNRGLAFFLLALILCSCEDPSEIGLELVPDKDKIGVYRAELPLIPRLIQLDSINTTNIDIRNNRLLAGYYSDPLYGNVTADAYGELVVNQATWDDTDDDPPSDTSVYQGLQLQLKTSYFYGLNFDDYENVNEFTIYELVDGFQEEEIPSSREITAYHPEALGSVIFDVSELQVEDSLLTINLTNELGERLFQKAKANNDSTFYRNRLFTEFFKGVAIIPANSNVAVLGINTADPATKMVLNYREGTENETIEFRFRARYYSRIISDFNNTPLAGLSPNNDLVAEPGGIYMQAGTGVIPVFDFAAYRNFADTVGDFVINDAQMVIKSLPFNENAPPPSVIYAFPTDSTNQILRSSNGFNLQTLSLDVSGRALLTNNPLNVNFNIGTLSYNQSSPGSNINITVFLEGILRQGNTVNRLILYPFFSGSTNLLSQSVNRFVPDRNQTKLILYYTKVN